MTRLATMLSLALPLFLLVAVGPASANLLINPGFESPAFVGAEAAGAGDGWTPFNANYRIQGQPPIGPAGAHGGTVVLKVFGVAGAFQDFPASEGQTWNGGAWILNDSADPMAGGQVAAVNIEWLDVGGGQISFISNGTFTLAACEGCSAPSDTWTLQTITGVAPAGTAFARFVLITGDFQPGGAGGAPRYDDAFFELQDPIQVEATTFGRLKVLYR
jgi:hypothetical protein